MKRVCETVEMIGAVAAFIAALFVEITMIPLLVALAVAFIAQEGRIYAQKKMDRLNDRRWNRRFYGSDEL